MRKEILDYICCPVCGKTLSLVSSTKLECKQGHKYPIAKGVPRLLIGDELTESQKETKESFEIKWDRMPCYGYDEKSRQFRMKWYLQRYGWSLDGLKQFIKTNKFILDAGTGLGSHVKFYAENTKGQVFGVDISRSVEMASKHVDLSNAHFIQADLNKLPFRKGFFDFIVADQVLHHTPNTEKSFKNLVELLKKEGQIAVYVYKKKGAVREFCDDYLRGYTTRMTAGECYKFCVAVTKLGKSLTESNLEFEVPEDIPYLNIKAGTYNLQRFIYWNMFKCFWNEDLDVETNVMTNFDWYHPKYAHRHSPEEVKQWFKNAGLYIVNFDVSESGISARGIKCVG